MNIQQAKTIPLRELLARLGRDPVKQVGADLWYLSPFRAETAPSFKINTERNIWYDFGEGVGGNILDFVMKVSGVATGAAALTELSAMLARPSRPVGAPIAPLVAPQRPISRTAVDDVLVRPLQHQALIAYLNGRGISAAVARGYVEEMHSVRGGKRYFSLAFKNASGGYELRNAYFKGTHGPKDITVVATPASAISTMTVFEGFLDFLSALVCDVLPTPRPLVLVLNSNALRDKAIAVIRERDVSRVDLYLDHDQSGHDLAAYFGRELTGIDVVDRSAMYAGHKDLNDFLVAHRRTT